MVVTDLFTVANLLRKNLLRKFAAKDSGGSGSIFRDGTFHIIGQITAVRPGIGTQLLFIERLQIIQGLLGGKAAEPVGFPLQSGQIIKRRGFFRVFLAFYAESAVSSGMVFLSSAPPTSADIYVFSMDSRKI